MAQRELVFKVERISDCDTGMYTMGEIDTIPDHAIRKYIETFGEYGYSEITKFLIRSLAVSHSSILALRINKEAQAATNVNP